MANKKICTVAPSSELSKSSALKKIFLSFFFSIFYRKIQDWGGDFGQAQLFQTKDPRVILHNLLLVVTFSLSLRFYFFRDNFRSQTEPSECLKKIEQEASSQTKTRFLSSSYLTST